MEQSFAEFQIPRWRHLPQLPLYMDQVLLVLGGVLEPLATEDSPMVTAAMINNYVKMKLTPPPEKKKYTREHLAWFLLICLMKKVLSMQEIAALKEHLLARQTLEIGYDRFCEELELRLRQPDGPDSPDCDMVLAAAVRSVACKLRVERLLAASAAETAKKQQESEK